MPLHMTPLVCSVYMPELSVSNVNLKYPDQTQIIIEMPNPHYSVPRGAIPPGRGDQIKYIALNHFK